MSVKVLIEVTFPEWYSEAMASELAAHYVSQISLDADVEARTVTHPNLAAAANKDTTTTPEEGESNG